jgi:hypothetical protein
MGRGLFCNEPGKRGHRIQLLNTFWRCLDTAADIAGPSRGSAKGLVHADIHDFFWSFVGLFAQAGLDNIILIADGASHNHKFFRLCSSDANGSTPWCDNPWTGERMYFRFDDLHALKNVRNQLSRSRLTWKPRLFHVTKGFIDARFDAVAATYRGRELPQRLTEEEKDKGELEQEIVYELDRENAFPEGVDLPGALRTASDNVLPSLPPLVEPTREGTERNSPTVSLEPCGRVAFGWFVLEGTRAWALRTCPNANALRWLTSAVLDLNGFSKMTVSLAQGICNPEVCSLLLISNDAVESKLRNLASPPSNRVNDASLVAQYKAKLEKLSRFLYSIRATLMYLHAMRRMYVDFAMARHPIHSESDDSVVAYCEGFGWFDAWHDDWSAQVYSSLADKAKHFLSHTTWS